MTYCGVDAVRRVLFACLGLGVIAMLGIPGLTLARPHPRLQAGLPAGPQAGLQAGGGPVLVDLMERGAQATYTVT